MLIGISRLNFFISFPKLVSSSLLSKSTTFLTSAIDSSKPIAALIGAVIPLTAPIVARIFPTNPLSLFLASLISRSSFALVEVLILFFRLSRSLFIFSLSTRLVESFNSFKPFL